MLSGEKMYKKIFLTGGTGFVGNEILQKLVEANYKVKVLTHKNKPDVKSKLIEIIQGNVNDPDFLIKSMKGCDVVIHLVGIIRENIWKGITFEKIHVESTKNMIAAAKENKIKQFLHMSANGAKPNGTKYQKTKHAAEEFVKKSGLEYTIFRPSIIFGGNDDFANKLAQTIEKYDVALYFGDGNYKLQPVSVETVANAFVKSINNNHSFKKIYHLGGPEAYTYNEILDIIIKSYKLKIIKLSFPVWSMNLLPIFEWIPQFPVTKDQIIMLLEGNICDSSEAKKDLDLMDINFVTQITQNMF